MRVSHISAVIVTSKVEISLLLENVILKIVNLNTMKSMHAQHGLNGMSGSLVIVSRTNALSKELAYGDKTVL